MRNQIRFERFNSELPFLFLVYTIHIASKGKMRLQGDAIWSVEWKNIRRLKHKYGANRVLRFFYDLLGTSFSEHPTLPNGPNRHTSKEMS